MATLTITSSFPLYIRVDLNDGALYDKLVVDSGATLSVPSAGESVRFNGTTTDGLVDNAGTLRNTTTGGRGIDIQSTVGTEFTASIINRATGTITSDNDALHIDQPITSGSISVDNAGTIQSTTRQAIDFLQASGIDVSINNTGSILADGDDAIRPGSDAAIINAGMIDGGSATGLTADADAIDFGSSVGTVTNKSGGSIIGDQHAVIGGDIDVINRAGGSLAGRAASAIVTDGDVTNNGTISGGNGTAIEFGSGDNTLTLGKTSSITGISEGGDGIDTLVYTGFTSGDGVRVSLASGSATGTGGVSHFENVTGSDRADYLVGDDQVNTLIGGRGADRLHGGTGDTLLGGSSNDIIEIDGAAALIDGGNNADTLVVTADTTLAAGSVHNIERVVVNSGVSADFSALTEGYTINSRSADGAVTTIIGTAGDDRITARLGDDVLSGGKGNDKLIGGDGENTFVFSEAGFGRDTITGFADGHDKIEISSALAADFASLDIIAQGDRTVIDFGNGDLILLSGFDATGLDASDFIFV